MNANDKFYARDAHVDSAAVAPLPSSRKIYVEGSRADIRVPMREIAQSDTPALVRRREESADRRLRHVGPYTDPGRHDRHPQRTARVAGAAGSPSAATRSPLDGPTSAYGRARLADPELAGLRFELHRKPRRARDGRPTSRRCTMRAAAS